MKPKRERRREREKEREKGREQDSKEKQEFRMQECHNKREKIMTKKEQPPICFNFDCRVKKGEIERIDNAQQRIERKRKMMKCKEGRRQKDNRKRKEEKDGKERKTEQQ